MFRRWMDLSTETPNAVLDVVDGGFSDCTSPRLQPLKGGSAQLITLECQRAEFGFDDRLLAIPGNQIAFDDAPAVEFQGDWGEGLLQCSGATEQSALRKLLDREGFRCARISFYLEAGNHSGFEQIWPNRPRRTLSPCPRNSPLGGLLRCSSRADPMPDESGASGLSGLRTERTLRGVRARPRSRSLASWLSVASAPVGRHSACRRYPSLTS